MLKSGQFFINLLAIFSLTSSCAFLENRTFVDEMEHETDGFFVPGQDFRTTPGDTGQAYRSRDEILQRTPASFQEKLHGLQDYSVRQELAIKEKSLSHNEYLRYREFSPYLESDSEKIYYLNLNSGERDDYLQSRGLLDDSTAKSRGSFEDRNNPSYSLRETLIGNFEESETEVYLGMDKESVERKLGRPMRIDIAGDPRYQNERWSFVENGRTKFVYFESGQVQGWAFD